MVLYLIEYLIEYWAQTFGRLYFKSREPPVCLQASLKTKDGNDFLASSSTKGFYLDECCWRVHCFKVFYDTEKGCGIEKER